MNYKTDDDFYMKGFEFSEDYYKDLILKEQMMLINVRKDHGDEKTFDFANGLFAYRIEILFKTACILDLSKDFFKTMLNKCIDEEFDNMNEYAKNKLEEIRKSRGDENGS